MRRTVSIDQLAYAAIGALVLVITWNGLRLAGGAVANAFLAIAFAAVVARMAILRRPPPLPGWLFGAAIGLFMAGMLTVIFPPDSSVVNESLVHFRTIPQPGTPVVVEPRSDLIALAQFEIGILVIPLMLASVATTPRRIERLLDLFVIGAVMNAGVGLVDWAGLDIAPIQAGEGRSAGLTVHPNYLALTCTIAIPLALLWIGRRGRWRIAGFAGTGLLLAGAYASGSRVGAVTAVLGVVVTLVAVPRLRSGLGFTVPAAGMILLALIVFAGDQILEQIRLTNDVSTAVNTTGSDTQRSQLADLAMHQFESQPLQGIGYSVIADAHSIYLQLLAAGGLIAMASFLVYIGGLAASAWRAFAGPQRDVAAAASVSILMWLINGVFDNQLADKYLFVIPGLLLALSYLPVAARLEPVPEEPADVPDTGSRVPSLAGAR